MLLLGNTPASLLIHLRRVDAEVGHGSDGLEDVAEDIDHGDVDDGLELAEELVRDPGAQDRGEVAEGGEGVVDGRGFVLEHNNCELLQRAVRRR